jgi:hypothetical protein
MAGFCFLNVANVETRNFGVAVFFLAGRVRPHGEVHARRVTFSGKRYKPNMKTILFLICIAILLTTSGCLVAEGGRHHHDAAVIVPVVPVVVVHPAAAVIVH